MAVKYAFEIYEQDELEFSQELYAMGTGSYHTQQTQHKPIFDPRSGKEYVPRGCNNPFIYNFCSLEKEGKCKNLHDPKSLYETAIQIQTRVNKFLANYNDKNSGNSNNLLKKPTLSHLETPKNSKGEETSP